MLRYAPTAWHSEAGLHVLYETTVRLTELGVGEFHYLIKHY